MPDPQQTNRTIILGRAIEDLDTTQTTLKVLVPEQTPTALTGAFAAGMLQSQVELATLSGGKTQVQVTTANHLIAVWQGTSNVAYPPAIKKGEQVEVIKYGDSDRYYWREMGRDRSLRQLDHHRIEVSATQARNVEKTDDNTYFLDLSAIDKSVVLKTSKANGEPFAYVINIDTKNGHLFIMDDAGPTPNRIYLNSGGSGTEPQVMLNNAKNAVVNLIGQDIIINAPRDILFQAGRQIIHKSPIGTINYDTCRINSKNLGLVTTNSTVIQAAEFGVSGNLKVTGTTVSGPVRAASYSIGDLNTLPVAADTNIVTATKTDGTNPVDTDSGLSQPGLRHAAAQEQVVSMMSTITTWFQEVQSKIGVPSVDSSLNTLATTSEMSKNAGT